MALGNTFAAANGISSDGATIVGVENVSGAEAFRWTESSGMLGLGFVPGGDSSFANAASGDGSVIIGSSSSTSGGQAFRWTESNGQMSGLGDLPGGGLDSAIPEPGSTGICLFVVCVAATRLRRKMRVAVS